MSFNTVIVGRNRTGNDTQALEVLNLMKESGVVPNTISYNSVIRAFGKNGNAIGAISLLEEMIKLVIHYLHWHYLHLYDLH